jgi:RimJ/RimL family protein N-acetyltransferase
MPVLTTSRLILRPVELEDAEELFSYRSDAETNKYQGWIPASLEEVHEFINNKVAKTFDVPDTWVQFVIINKEDNKLIGDLGVHFIDEDKTQSELGCTLDKQYHGHGFALEAMKVVIDYLFNNLNKHRIHASVDPRNINSVKLMENLGFRKEAHFRESLFLNNEWVDDVIYAILKPEWVNR